MKEVLGEKIMKEFVGLRAKTYSYLISDGNEDNKAKGTKKFVVKRRLQFEYCKHCLKASQLEIKLTNHVKK